MRLIVRWEKSWVQLQEISKGKKRINCDLWIYNGDLNDVMHAFVRTQGDSKFKNS